MMGRRRDDVAFGDLPDNIRRGDFWKYLNREDGVPLIIPNEPSNLTTTCWGIAAPIGDGNGFAIGTLMKHTVREEDDGTISVRPGDGSSNSIKIRGAFEQEWHGYIERGEWREA